MIFQSKNHKFLVWIYYLYYYFKLDYSICDKSEIWYLDLIEKIIFCDSWKGGTTHICEYWLRIDTLFDLIFLFGLFAYSDIII